MLLYIDFGSEIPIYEQIVTGVIKGVGDGTLSSGELLPSMRELASDLNINMHTVRKAYLQLQDMGFIEILKKKGALVREKPTGDSNDFYRRIEQKLLPILFEAKSRGITNSEMLTLINQLMEEKIGGNKND
ncbi:GntR family transcriptional regulator [Bacillus carboniphilus]|uniref:GntR family transcriptional regulator n=1 Tax=Bacillus carboniphilus TaxID=86663 RepID=A0ABN0WR36_9BACI